MRDRLDNCVVVCSIENFDPMGVHTGDSVTVAPAQTLSDVEYQKMRDDAFACIRRVGVETGGSNIQFAVDPATGERLVIEMNPRVSRSSALASKATGLPDRQDRRPAGGGIHARRDRQRHHQGDAGELRADHRLRRDESAPLGLREAPRRPRRPRHTHAVGRRGDGDRTDLRGVVAKGAAGPRARAGGPQLRPGRAAFRRPPHRRARAAGRRSRRRTGLSSSSRPCGAASAWTSWRRRPGSIRGSSTASPASSPSGNGWRARRHSLARHRRLLRPRPAGLAAGEDGSGSPTPSSPTSSVLQRRRRARPAWQPV